MTRSYAIGYSTCGFAAGLPLLELLHELGRIGYEGVELELDRERLHPEVHGRSHVLAIAEACRRYDLRMVLGTGGRHVLTQQRHEPGCVSREASGRRRWLDFIHRSIELAAVMGAECVMLHSGYAPRDVPAEDAWGWLIEGASWRSTLRPPASAWPSSGTRRCFCAPQRTIGVWRGPFRQPPSVARWTSATPTARKTRRCRR
jgi:sugar phosphate isomerase/epimerase